MQQSGDREFPGVAAVDPANRLITETVAQQVVSPDRVAMQSNEFSWKVAATRKIARRARSRSSLLQPAIARGQDRWDEAGEPAPSTSRRSYGRPVREPPRRNWRRQGSRRLHRIGEIGQVNVGECGHESAAIIRSPTTTSAPSAASASVRSLSVRARIRTGLPSSRSRPATCSPVDP